MTGIVRWIGGLLLTAATACGGTGSSASANTTAALGSPDSTTVQQQGYRVVNTYPHDPEAWTQGLLVHDGSFLEGTGRPDSSYLREVDITTGIVKRQAKMPAEYFGEGVAVAGSRVYQLTWQRHKGFYYDVATFRKLGEWDYEGEGWGLTFDGTHLIQSDGTATLRFLNLETFAVVKRVEVKDGDRAIDQLNELEMVKGELFANVWQSDSIVRIDPASGRVKGWINLSGLLTDSDYNRYEVDVLNGIAYDPATDRLFVTGKLWPKLFEIKLVDGRQ
jgi:glutamine cyclotransferase